MRKHVFVFAILLTMCSSFITGCGNSGKKQESPAAEAVKDQYKCPMKCSEQLFDKPGKCPECGMVLEKVTKS